MNMSSQQTWRVRLYNKIRSWGPSEWGVVVVFFGAITGMLPFILAWLLDNSDAKSAEDKAIKLHDEWNEPQMLARQSRMADAMSCKLQPEIDKYDPAIKELGYYYMDGYSKAVTATKSYKGIEEDLVYFYQFFGRINSCIKDDRCDAATACRLFYKDAADINHLFRPRLHQLRRSLRTPKLGREFRDFMLLCAEKAPATDGVKKTADLIAEETAYDELARKSEVWRKEHPREAADEAKPGWSAACERMRPDYRAGSASPAGEGG